MIHVGVVQLVGNFDDNSYFRNGFKVYRGWEGQIHERDGKHGPWIGFLAGGQFLRSRDEQAQGRDPKHKGEAGLEYFAVTPKKHKRWGRNDDLILEGARRFAEDNIKRVEKRDSWEYFNWDKGEGGSREPESDGVGGWKVQWGGGAGGSGKCGAQWGQESEFFEG